MKNIGKQVQMGGIFDLIILAHTQKQEFSFIEYFS